MTFNNLSEKICIQDEIGDDEMYNTLYEYQVKEFIKLLLEYEFDGIIHMNVNSLKKLAGEKLI